MAHFIPLSLATITALIENRFGGLSIVDNKGYLVYYFSDGQSLPHIQYKQVCEYRIGYEAYIYRVNQKLIDICITKSVRDHIQGKTIPYINDMTIELMQEYQSQTTYIIFIKKKHDYGTSSSQLSIS